MREPPQDPANRLEYEISLDALVQLGWLESWGKHGDDYAYSWTTKGRERRRWLRTIDRELQADERAMGYVMAICCAPGGNESDDAAE